MSDADPAETFVIHAAARVEWSTPAAVIANASMAVNVAAWAQSVGIRFSVLVSGVNVYSNRWPASTSTPADPETLYGLGKLTAERAWRLVLPQDRQAVVRLAGVWGWQKHPTLFWNRLLLNAAGVGSSGLPLTIRRTKSIRNYIPVTLAAECLIGVAMEGMAGTFLAAGSESLDLGMYVDLLHKQPGEQLEINVQDDGGQDDQLYTPSPELSRWLGSVRSMLPLVWAERPVWVDEAV